MHCRNQIHGNDMLGLSDTQRINEQNNWNWNLIFPNCFFSIFVFSESIKKEFFVHQYLLTCKIIRYSHMY